MKKIFALLLVLGVAIAAHGQASFSVPNAGTTGTTLNSTATIGTAYTAVIATTSNTTVPVYIVAAGAGTSGVAVLAFGGQALCTFDANNASGAGGWFVIASTTTGGDCHAQSAAPAYGVWVIGYLDSASTSSGGTAAVNVVSAFYPAALTAAQVGTAFNIAQYDLLESNGTTAAPVGIAPSSTSGVPLISQGSSSNPAYGTAVVAGGGTGDTTLTAYAPLFGGTTSTAAVQSGTAGTAGQVETSGGASAIGSYKDLYMPWFIPAANCNNTTAGAGWSIGSSGVVVCRAGTNNLGGAIQITDTAGTFAQFSVKIPGNWDSSVDPYITFDLAAVTDTTNGHTIIPQIKVSCPTATNGTTSDDATFSAAQSVVTITLGASAVANGYYGGYGAATGSTQMTGCVANGLMIVQIGRATDTVTGNVNFYGATITWPLQNLVQAN